MLRELRMRLDEQYADGKRALDVLEAHLSGALITAADRGEAASLLSNVIAYMNRRGSLRARVREAIRDDYKSINQIAAETGLTTKQIRGVVYNPDMKGEIKRSNAYSDGVRFKLNETT